MNFSLQDMVIQWLENCFGRGAAESKNERRFRFMEEAVELFQAAGGTPDEIHRVIEHVYSKPPGQVSQEIAGCYSTLLAFAHSYNIDAEAELRFELNRVSTPEAMRTIRAKSKRKVRS